MISALVADSYSPPPTASGTGGDSQVLWEQLIKANDDFLLPVNMREWRDALTLFTELPLSHSNTGWDGEDAEPLSVGSMIAARVALLLLFKAGVPAPEIGVDADGEVAFEWSAPRKSVIFTFRPNGTLSHTALYNDIQETPGTVVFSDSIPALLLDKIARVYRPNRG